MQILLPKATTFHRLSYIDNPFHEFGAFRDIAVVISSLKD